MWRRAREGAAERGGQMITSSYEGVLLVNRSTAISSSFLGGRLRSATDAGGVDEEEIRRRARVRSE
jgi:hypothetical protein